MKYLWDPLQVVFKWSHDAQGIYKIILCDAGRILEFCFYIYLSKNKILILMFNWL